MESLVFMTLLERTVICRYINPDLYAWLSEPENLTTTNQWFSRIDNYITQNSAESAYFSSPIAIDERNRSGVTEQATSMKRDLFPVFKFILLVLNARQTPSILSGGGIIKVSELLSAITEASPLQESLKALASNPPFKCASDNPQIQLTKILETLSDQKMRYLEPGKKGLSYTVSGKVDYLFDMMAFDNDYSKLGLEKEDQMDLQKGLSFEQ